jgi:hypothetical protein
MRISKIIRISEEMDKEIKNLKSKFNLEISENEIIIKLLSIGIEIAKSKNLTNEDFRKKVTLSTDRIIIFFESLKRNNYYKASKEAKISVNNGLKIIKSLKKHGFIETKQGRKTLFLKELTIEDVKKII